MNNRRISWRRLAPFRLISIAVTLSALTACVSHHMARKTVSQRSPAEPDLICPDAHTYVDRVVGDGHCVSLIKRCSGAPDTINWRPGEKVLNADLPPGTIIATFHNDRYPSRRGYHAAIYIEQDERGIWVWDQWVGKPVHKRLIRIRHDRALASNSAQSYRVVKLP